MNSQYYFSTYTSRRVERVAVGRREYPISYGDKLSVRVTVGSNAPIEYETRNVSDMTDLIGDLRHRAKGQRGLAVMTIRNHDRGWVRERHIMLYPERAYVPSPRVTTVRRQMMNPWEH